VITRYYWEWPPFGFLSLPAAGSTATVAGDGSFALSDPAPVVVESGFPVRVSLSVTAGVQVYRSGYIPLAEAQFKELNLWLYVDQLPTSDGISAGTISQQVGGAGLPDNTTINAGGPYGLHFTGSEGQVNIDFNIGIAPDTSPNLNDFLDLSVIAWNINVDWPTSWFTSAPDVLNQIKSGIAAAGSKVNQAVLQRMEGILRSEEGLTASMASDFLSDVSVTFSGVGYPTSHSWGIGDTSDDTIVLAANPCIGFPRETLPLRFSTHP
jgi:hypothetical protein